MLRADARRHHDDITTGATGSRATVNGPWHRVASGIGWGSRLRLAASAVTVSAPLVGTGGQHGERHGCGNADEREDPGAEHVSPPATQAGGPMIAQTRPGQRDLR